MSDETDSWLQTGFNIDIGAMAQKIQDAGSAVVNKVEAAGAAVEGSSTAAVNQVEGTAAGAGDTLKSAGSTMLDLGNRAGNAIQSAESSAWDGAKGAYTTVTDAYDSVAPNFTQANKDLGSLVDAGEDATKRANDKAVAEYGDVPVLGSLVKANAWLSNATTQATGGVVKGVGDLAAMGGNAIFHPIDAAESLGEGALGIAEHVPLVPGMNTMVKGAHGLVDLARGKTDGEYGSNLSDLGENLLMNTHQDKDDPSKRSNADLDFLAAPGGGTKAWSDKPVEAATRTITNLVPMFLGDEAAAGGKPPPEVPPPEVPPPEVPPPEVPKPPSSVDPFGETQPGSRGGPPSEPPPTEVDPPTERDPQPPPAEGELTATQAQENLQAAAAAHDAALAESVKATGDYVRYHAEMPDSELGRPGRQGWDPDVDTALRNEADRVAQKSIDRLHDLEAAQRAARDAVARANRRPGGGGFPPPRR